MIIDKKAIFDWEQVKEKITATLRERKTEDERILCMDADPWKLSFELVIAHNEKEQAIAHVSKELLEAWGKTLDEVYEQWKKNTMWQAEVVDIEEVMLQMVGGDDPINLLEAEGTVGQKMLVLSTVDRYRGAALITIPEIREKIRSLYGEDYHIIASSIHEVLTVPVSLYGNAELNGTIKQINETEVEDNERVSDHAYRYSASGVTRED